MNEMEVYQKIHTCYKQENYEEVLIYFSQYVSLKNIGINDVLLNIYAKSLENLQFLEEALKIYQIKQDYFHMIHDDLKIIYLAMRLDKLELATEIIKRLLFQEKNNFYYNYLYGKILLLNGDKEEAKKRFEICKNETQEIFYEKVQIYLKRLENNDEFKMGYQSFLKKGKKLELGHIVTVKKRIEYINEDELNNDEKSINRPYLIWKIEKDFVYAFPTTSKITKFDYSIFPSKYKNISTILTCKDNVCKISKSDIASVVEKIDAVDYHNLLLYVYDEIMHNLAESKNKKNVFLKEMNHLYGLNVKTTR